MIKQPYYMIDFAAVSCLFEIRVNDIPVITLNLPSQVSTKIPINHAISRSSKQEVLVRILPVLGQSFIASGTEFKYDIQLFDVSNGFDFKQKFDGYKTDRIDEQEVISIISNTKVFEADIPYQLRDYWRKGEDLRSIDDLTRQLRSSYCDLGEIIGNGNYNLLKERMADREYNMAASMYLSLSESQARFDGLIKDFRNGFDIMSLPEDAVAVLSAYGKKAALKKTNGEPALSFINKESGEELMLDIEFYQPKDSNDFKII